MKYKIYVKDKDLNYLFYDIGVTSNNNNTAWTKTNATANYDSTGTNIVLTANWGKIELSNDDWFDKLPIAIEFEVVDVTTMRFYSYSGYNVYYEITQTGNYRFEVTTSAITVKRNGEAVTTLNPPVSATDITFQSNLSGHSLKFKDFKIYRM